MEAEVAFYYIEMKNPHNNPTDRAPDWPKEHVIKLDPAHADARGAIQCLVNLPTKNVSLISSKQGSLRSNHYHKTDWHYMYVLTGRFEYYYRPAGSSAAPKMIVLSRGDMVFTPPLEDHATVFLEDTDLVVMSKNLRDQAAYESDVVRVELIDPQTMRVK
jgi:quercetin dioxygenase-like cupin family protein